MYPYQKLEYIKLEFQLTAEYHHQIFASWASCIECNPLDLGSVGGWEKSWFQQISLPSTFLLLFHSLFWSGDLLIQAELCLIPLGSHSNTSKVLPMHPQELIAVFYLPTTIQKCLNWKNILSCGMNSIYTFRTINHHCSASSLFWGRSTGKKRRIVQKQKKLKLSMKKSSTPMHHTWIRIIHK